MDLSNEKTEECSLRIGTIWSEAVENLLVKEEIVSDMEPDCIASQENSNSCLENETDNQAEDEGNVYTNTTVLPVWQPLKKKVKSRAQRSEETEVVINHKLSCLHDTKNFKIVKRRLRCGDCRSLVCPECCKVMIPNLQSHFLGSGVGSSGTFLCKLCGIIFHSLCALQAHIRIHTMDTPYVCPDCGLIYNNIYFLILHLLNKCYHVYKIVRYKCKHCTGAYFTPETFVRHIQETHIHCVFRCLYCSSLFNNYDEFNYHMENLHQKQKVQYLNYFRCSLCSNMVIPRFMYQRHIAQHRENSEFYEIDYQCLCGEIYSLIGAFRSHFTYCGKKGLLPPRWSFLQRKLRTQDVLRHENFQNEVVVQSLPICSSNEAEFNNLTLVRSVDTKITLNDEGRTAKGELSVKNNFHGSGEMGAGLDVNKKICKKQNDKSGEESGVCGNNFKNLINSTSINEVKSQNCEKEEKVCHTDGSGNEPTSADLKQHLKDTTKDPSNAESSYAEGLYGCKSSMESEQIDGDMYKIYDHIPCDHLGYVIKAQCPEPPPKKACQVNDIVLEKTYSPRNCKIVTELDEKTGIISTKTVPVEESEVDEEEGNINDDDHDDLESLNFSTTAKAYSNDKIKFKVGNSLSCPFCIVLFPKHNLTFQQFRLHLESYHPDAALNISVSKEEKAQDKTCSRHSDSAEMEGKIDNCTDLKKGTMTCANLESPNNRSLDSSNCEKLSSPEENQNDLSRSSVSKNSGIQPGNEVNTVAVNDKASPCDDEGADLTGESNKFLKTLSEEVCPVQQPAVGDGNEKDQSWGVEECKVETILAPTAVGANMDVNFDTKDFDINKDDKKESNGLENTNDKPNTEEKKTGDTYNESAEEGAEEIEEDQRMEETTDVPHCPEYGEKKTISELEYEGETSKDSNWSIMSAKDSRTNSPDQSKPEEKERSRRESEVWSEFYESLMLAEKLKKKKKESQDSKDKKKSVVSDYSAKRIVKKPKRYRESSESADSNEYSDSDDEFLLKGDFMDKTYSEDNGEDQLNKKQLLLNKLENVDGKFVDYLFDVVTKKEKLFELYKSLRTSRYSHDLRSYRKKVLNGIKQRGRPLKILRYHELLKKKELILDRNNKESYQFKKKGDFSPESKTNERKRGRPRKYRDPAKLKERRRSDKEVDFIEKNFEREENDFSPSKRKRKLSSKLQYYRKMSDEKDDFSSGQVINNKPPDSSRKFTCAVCKEVFPGYSELREHIVVHRMEENTYQCLECGECFVVRPSLEKHLHAFHKIKNTDKYITENQCCNIKKEVIEVENEPLKENQCKVCKDQFDRPIDLTKHFRIHGMAFLKEFRKETRSNEKKNV